MPPKTDGPPRPKKVMTPEMLEKLAAARAKANVARAAMKSDNDELKLQLLQRKMDAIKKTTMKAPKPETPEQIPDDIKKHPNKCLILMKCLNRMTYILMTFQQSPNLILMTFQCPMTLLLRQRRR